MFTLFLLSRLYPVFFCPLSPPLSPRLFPGLNALQRKLVAQKETTAKLKTAATAARDIADAGVCVADSLAASGALVTAGASEAAVAAALPKVKAEVGEMRAKAVPEYGKAVMLASVAVQVREILYIITGSMISVYCSTVAKICTLGEMTFFALRPET